jgi:hypothetical protein
LGQVNFCPECGAKLGAKSSAKSEAKTSASGQLAQVVALGSKTKPSTKNRYNYENPWFQRFWQEYPRRIAKKPAYKAFNNAVKNGANPEAIIDATKVFAAVHRRKQTEPQFIPYPASWLNDERYEDEPEQMAAGAGERPAEEYVGTPEYEARMKAEGIW